MKSNKKKDPIIVHNDRGESIRLNKYISESGFCSRREADKFIESGKVTVDGVKIDFPTEWVHLRKSNTEPIIRIYTESTSEENANKLADKMIESIKNII